MIRFGILQRAQISSCFGTTGFQKTVTPNVRAMLSLQGVARVQLTTGTCLTLPVFGVTRPRPTTAYTTVSVKGGFKFTQFVGHRRVCNSSKGHLLRTGQVRNNFLCASLTSAEFWISIDPVRPWTTITKYRPSINSNVEAVSHRNIQSGKRLYHSHSEGPGLEIYPSTFNSSEKTKKFVKTLRRKQRALLMNELQILEKELNKDAIVEEQTMLLPPSRKQLRLVLLNNAVPFIGFGFLDNAIMIAAGDYIDWKIGAALHISTMAAAGFGNLISDLAGVVLAGYVETFAARLGIPSPNLSLEQYEMNQSKLASSIGRCVGIAIGCLLGMFPLLFLDNDRDEEESKEEKDKDTSTEL